MVNAVALLALGIAFLHASTHDARQTIGAWANLLRVDPHNRWLNAAMAKLSGLSGHQLAELGLGTFVYAVLFLIEGVGLWRRKLWAEWFTIAITGSFVPLEVYEIAKEPSALKVVVLVSNVAGVIYLLARRIGSMTSGRRYSSTTRSIRAIFSNRREKRPNAAA